MTHFLKYFARVLSAQKTCNSEHTWDLKLQRISCHSRSSGKVFHLCGHDDVALAPWRVWKVCHTHHKCTWQPHYREPLDDQTIASQLGKTFDRTHNCKAGLLLGMVNKLMFSVSIHLIKTQWKKLNCLDDNSMKSEEEDFVHFCKGAANIKVQLIVQKIFMHALKFWILAQKFKIEVHAKFQK